MVHHRGEDIQRKLNEYYDRSALVKVPDGVELLIPAQLFAIHKMFRINYSKFEMMALEGILSGWSLSPYESESSVGQVCEGPMLKMVCSNNFFSLAAPGTYSFHKKSFTTISKSMNP
jgi:hypothetical protein